MNTANKNLRSPAADTQPMALDESAIDAARHSLDQGAVTPSSGPWRDDIVKLLNDSLATELVCVLRYRRHHFTAQGLASSPIADEFLVHANEELGHADRLARRIVQLGGEPDFAPNSLAGRSHAQYIAGTTLVDMIREDLVAERIAIDSYRDMVRYLGDQDPTTSTLLKKILAVEEEHADELADLLEGMPSQSV